MPARPGWGTTRWPRRTIRGCTPTPMSTRPTRISAWPSRQDRSSPTSPPSSSTSRTSSSTSARTCAPPSSPIRSTHRCASSRPTSTPRGLVRPVQRAARGAPLVHPVRRHARLRPPPRLPHDRPPRRALGLGGDDEYADSMNPLAITYLNRLSRPALHPRQVLEPRAGRRSLGARRGPIAPIPPAFSSLTSPSPPPLLSPLPPPPLPSPPPFPSPSRLPLSPPPPPSPIPPPSSLPSIPPPSPSPSLPPPPPPPLPPSVAPVSPSWCIARRRCTAVHVFQAFPTGHRRVMHELLRGARSTRSDQQEEAPDERWRRGRGDRLPGRRRSGHGSGRRQRRGAAPPARPRA